MDDVGVEVGLEGLEVGPFVDIQLELRVILIAS